MPSIGSVRSPWMRRASSTLAKPEARALWPSVHHLDQPRRSAFYAPVEASDAEPPGMEGHGIEVGPVGPQVGEMRRRVAMHNVFAVVTLVIEEAMPDPHQSLVVLRIERHAGQDARMHEEMLLGLVAERQIAKPVQHVDRHRSAEGLQCGVAAIVQPEMTVAAGLMRVPGHLLVIAAEADPAFAVASRPVHQAGDDFLALRTAVDIVAEEDDGRRVAAAVARDLLQRLQQQIVAAMDIADGIDRLGHQSLLTIAPAGLRRFMSSRPGRWWVRQGLNL